MPRAWRGWITPRPRSLRGERLPAGPGPRPRPRPLASLAHRSPLLDLDAMWMLGPALVDVGLQVSDRRADREERGTLAGIPEPSQVTPAQLQFGADLDG